MNSIKIKKSKLNKQNSSKDIERLKKEEQIQLDQEEESEQEEESKEESEQDSEQDSEQEESEQESEQEQEQEDITNIKILKKRGRKPKLKSQDELKTIEILKQKKLEKKQQKEINNNIKLEKKKEKEKEKEQKKEEKKKERNQLDDNETGAMTTKRRGRKPKDKFKYETNNQDEYGNIKTDENLIIKLPLSCLKLNNELNYSKNLFSYNPNLTEPKPYTLEDNTLKT